MKTLPTLQVAVSLGLFVGLSMLLMSVFANAGYGTPWVDMIGSVYRGYDLTSAGMVKGVLYGFADGFIGGGIFCFIFNWVGTWLQPAKKGKK